MTNKLLSKLSLSTWFLFLFCLSLIIAVSIDGYQYEFYFAVFLLVIFLFLIVNKQKNSVILLAISLGIIVANYGQFVSISNRANLCTDATILTSAKRSKRSFVYKMKDKNGSFLISTDNDSLKISDKVHLCFLGKVELERADRNYFLSQFKHSSIYNVSSLEKISDGSGLRRTIADVSVKIKAASQRIYSGDEGVLAYGLIFGSSSDFSSKTKADLKRSGTSHLVAVSGYNVSIITSWLFTTLRAVSKNFAGVFSFITLILFYFLTGGSASVLRAAIMGTIILVSKFIGRRVLPFHLLLLAAALILTFNPFAIYDWGFQLSFLATAGLFFLAVDLEKILSFGRFKSLLIKIFAETLSAQFFVLPILASNFGQFSIVSPISNLLILPFVPLTMLFVAITLILEFVSTTLGIFFGGISQTLLSYILLVIKYSSSFKFSSVSYTIKPAIGYAVGYAVVLTVTYLIRRYVGQRADK